jgi:hypothetical protein
MASLYNSKMYMNGQFFSESILYCQFSSGARQALPMGVALEATTKCLHLDVGSTLLWVNSIFLFLSSFLINSIIHTADKCCPRAYVPVLASKQKLQTVSRIFSHTYHRCWWKLRVVTSGRYTYWWFTVFWVHKLRSFSTSHEVWLACSPKLPARLQ